MKPYGGFGCSPGSPAVKLPSGASPRRQQSTGGGSSSDMMLYTSQVMGSSPMKQELPSSDSSGGGKTYKCPKCDKEFQQKSHFFGHMNSHLNVRPYSCDKCGKGFAYSQNLARHQKSCFTPSKHACTFCGITLANAQELQMHLIQAHSGATSWSTKLLLTDKVSLMFVCFFSLKAFCKIALGD